MPINHQVMNIAHRGARSLAPENTLLAAQKAFEIGADMWELDCGMLADDTIIVLHDDTFARTTNISEVYPSREADHLSTFTYPQVQELNAGQRFLQTDPFGQIRDGGIGQDELAAMEKAAVPTLEEALLFTKDKRWKVNVEIKDMKGTPGDNKIVPSVIRLVQSMGMLSDVLISSFNHHYLRQCKALDDRIETACLVVLPAFWNLKKPSQLNCAAYHPPVYGLSDSHIRQSLRRGYKVNVWTVNESDKMHELINLGVSGIITDFPQRLKTLLSPQE